ncbi:MAG TPA: hypothetical protein PLB52_02855 [Candidatus Moranbacteria bacterium]|nr:hypothetical protein [Candidatus Moranbacteria bacterium]
MKFKIATFFFIIALIVIGYFAYPILKNRYFSDTQTAKNVSDSTQQMNVASDPGESPDELPASDDGLSIMNNSAENPEGDDEGLSIMNKSMENSTKDSAPIMEIEKPNANKEKQHLRITAEYCDGECEFFENNPIDFKYCQEVCGLTQIQKPTGGCETEQNLEKDYCFEHLAITEKNSSLCEKIEDTNIKLTCKNRILQDIIENQ